ncbi:tyrosinase family protein [Hymenobacter baengnokdamensis]|uniref:tyrosinase family protein n=1 Tax=Hymenobacter baengnokdamensis TaxID=2615203 RepID=UPI0012460DE3|nr:tyrosinase family protein [Hymenobacter baengnokdamensis]
MQHPFSFPPARPTQWAGLLLLGGLLASGCQSGTTTKTEEKTTPALTTARDSTARTSPARPAGGFFVRHNAASPEGQADLAALQKAMALMKNMPCDNPLSWYYQGAIHNVPSYSQASPLCAPFGKDKPFAWDGCTHGSGEHHFLVWHRLFTWHLERIVRKLSGKADFALPYWDYITPATRIMPAAFRNAGASRDSLSNVERSAWLNQGKAIGPWMNPVLNTTTLFQNRLFTTFNTELDQGLHGAMHDYIGSGTSTGIDNTPRWNRIYQRKVANGMMGNVPSAGFDPVFWVHHANIDLLWTQWAQSPQGQRPNLDSLKADNWNHYNFIDENGKHVSYSVDSAYALAMHPDYRYDRLPAPPAAKAKEDVVLLAQGRPNQSTPPVTLATTRVGKSVVTTTSFTARLAVPAPKAGLLKSATPQPGANARPQRLLLRVEASLSQEPSGFYALYVRRQGGTGPLATQQHLAGVLNFFGATHHHDGPGMEGMVMPKASRFTRTFVFDITDEVDAASFGQALDVQVVPAGTNGVPITIEQLTLVTQAI